MLASSFVASSFKSSVRTLPISSFQLHGLPPTLSTTSTAAPIVAGQSVPFTILSALAIAISYADRSNLSTAIIPMAAAFNWDSLFSGVVLSAFWGGYALTQVLGGRLADKFGGEKLLIIAMLIWSLMTAATPHAAAMGNIPVIAARVLLGAGEGLALPAIHSMIQKYVVAKERATSAAVITAACYLGALLSNLFAPMVISTMGWQACFYYFAALPPLVWIPLWVFFLMRKGAQNSPSSGEALLEDAGGAKSQSVARQGDTSAGAGGGTGTVFEYQSIGTQSKTVDGSVSGDETDSLIDESSEAGAVEADCPPASIRELLRSPPVWAIILAQYGQSWGMIGLLSWLPTYYSQRFGVPIDSLGSFTVLPYFLQMVVAIGAGFLADKLVLSGIRTLWVRHSLQITGMLAPAACLAYCAYSPGLTAVEAAAVITAGSAISSLTVGAVSCNHFDISPRNAGTIFGIGNTASCIGGLIAVPGSGWLFDKTHSWDAVFLMFAVHYVGGALLWGLLASDQPLKLSSKWRGMGVDASSSSDDDDNGGGSGNGSGSGSSGSSGNANKDQPMMLTSAL